MKNVVINEVHVSYIEVAESDQYTPFDVLVNQKELSAAVSTDYQRFLDVLTDREDFFQSTVFEGGLPYLPVPYCLGMLMLVRDEGATWTPPVEAGYMQLFKEFFEKPREAYRNSPEFLN